MKLSRYNFGYKNNSLRTFVLLRGCSGDDTILNGKLMYLFGVLKETYWRMFHPMTVPVGAGAVFYLFQQIGNTDF